MSTLEAIDAVCDRICKPIHQMWGWEGEKDGLRWIFCNKQAVVDGIKMGVHLIANNATGRVDQVDMDAFSAWCPPVGRLSTRLSADVDDYGLDYRRVRISALELVARHCEAIEAAEFDRERVPFCDCSLICNAAAIGRNCAAIGEADAAENALRGAVKHCSQVDLPWLGAIALQDLIQCVLATQPARAHKANHELRELLSRLLLPEVRYTELLGFTGESGAAEH